MPMTFITPSAALPCPRLWKDFPASGVVRATLAITGLGLYRAFLNGRRIGGDYLTPGFNDYDAYLRCRTYDVTDLLESENRLEVYLGDGWYKGRFGIDGGKENRWGERYLLAARLTLTSADGAERVLETDESWRASLSPVILSGIYDGETRDDTRDLGAPVPCVKVETGYHLTEQFSPPVRAVCELPATLIVTPKGETVLDFGQNAAGVIRFTNRLPRGATMRIQTGEVLQQGNFYRDNLRSAKSEFLYTSDGVVKPVEPMFTFFGFRYAKVESPVPVDPSDFALVALSSDLKTTLQCQTDHAALNRLLQNAFWGQRSNFLDVPTDCPQRDERLGWTADTQVFVNTACYQMDCKAFYRKFMRDMREDQLRYYGGDIPAFSPSLKGEAIHGGAVWADAGTIIPWHVYRQYGDAALLRENYPMMRDYTETLIAADARLGGTHLVFDGFTFGDWLAQDGMTPQSLKGGTEDAYIQGVYYMHSVALTAKAAEVVGQTTDASRYRTLAADIKAALLDEYLSPNGRLTVDTQTGYALALYYGVYRDKDKLLTGLRRRLERDFFRITCGFTGAPLLLPVLWDNGMGDAAYRMLLSEDFPGWLYAVNLGATTIWERWNSLEKDGAISGTGMNSLNHYAYGAVCEAVYSRVMGLENAAPGWTRARIAPRINGRIRHSDIRFDSPAGVYAVTWDIGDNGTVTLTAAIPANAEADIILPDHPESLRETVRGGTHRYAYTPVVDYLHSFSARSLTLDILANERAAAALCAHTPALYATVLDPNSEFRVMSPVEIVHTLPYLRHENIQALDAALRAV